MNSYPPLQRLSLAPRETSAAPGEELKKHQGGDYQERLQEWKATKTLQERWYQYRKGRGFRAYFEDAPKFFMDWIPVAEQESYFYERRDDKHRLIGVIHPAQTILRVAADSMNTTIAELAKLRTWIVDGSNLLDANESRFTIHKKIRDLKNAYPADKYPGDCAIIVCKAEGLSDAKNTQPIVNEKNQRLDPVQTFEQKYNGFGRHWDWMQDLAPPDKIFLVVVEDWIDHEKFDARYKGPKYVYDDELDRFVLKKNQVKKERVCGQDKSEGEKPDDDTKVMTKKDVDELGFQHWKCEYDDMMCITLRQLLTFHKDAAAAAPAAAAAAPADASDDAGGWETVTKDTKEPKPLGRKTFGEWGPDPHTGDPKLKNEKAWRNRDGEDSWRLSPHIGVVTDDKRMWENLYPEAIARSYEQLLKFSDVFRIRIFMPLGRQGPPPTPPEPTYPKPPRVEDAIRNINAKRRDRYVLTSDSMLSGALEGFFGEVLALVNKKAVLFDPKTEPKMVRDRLEAEPVNWAFTNQLRKATPPGWGETQFRSKGEVAEHRALVVKKALGEKMATDLDTWYKEWKTPSASASASASAPPSAPAPAPAAADSSSES